MQIRSYEFKKIITSPILMGVLLFFVFFNIFLLTGHFHMRKELKVANGLARELGHEINEEMLGSFQDSYEEQLKKMNQMTETKTSKTYSDGESFLTDIENNHGLYTAYTQQELEQIYPLRTMETYLHLMEGMEEQYESLDMKEVAEGQIKMYGLSRSAAETVKKYYGDLEKRLEELLGNGEHKHLFFIGQIYRMHSLLYKDIFRVMVFEAMILVVLITGYLMNYEFENNTSLLVYSTKRGRNIIQDKLLVSIGAGILTTTLILGITLIGYFSLFSYKGLWKVPMSNYFNWETSFPLISWWNMSFLQYLVCAIVLVYLCSILFIVISFIISIFLKNSYLTFFAFGILFGLILLLPDILPRSSNVLFLSGFTPFNLLIYPNNWFMARDPSSMVKYYEAAVIGIWTLLLLTLGSITATRFQREDIY